MQGRPRPVRVAAAGIGIVLVAAGSIAVVRDVAPDGLRHNAAAPWWLDYTSDDSPADPSESKAPSIHLLVGPADEDEPLPTPSIPPAPPGSADPGSSAPGSATPGDATPDDAAPVRSNPGGSTPGGAKPAPAAPPPAAPAPTIGQPAFAAVTGEQCPQDASRGYQRADGNGGGGGGGGDGGRGGRSSNGGRDGGRDSGRDGGWNDSGWRSAPSNDRSTSYLRNSGGWTGNGCAGAFQAMPMTGDSRSSAYSLWWFRTGAVKQGNCAISVFVPKAQASGDVTARPASYAVLTGSRLANAGSFAIDQVANQGRWVGAGTRPVRDGVVAVQLLNRGGDRGDHAGSAQVKVNCRAS